MHSYEYTPCTRITLLVFQKTNEQPSNTTATTQGWGLVRTLQPLIPSTISCNKHMHSAPSPHYTPKTPCILTPTSQYRTAPHQCRTDAGTGGKHNPVKKNTTSCRPPYLIPLFCVSSGITTLGSHFNATLCASAHFDSPSNNQWTCPHHSSEECGGCWCCGSWLQGFC